MYIVPDSTITLHNNIPTTNPLYFKTQSAQDTYFASHILKQSTPCQYVKHSQTRLRVACTVAQARQCPYISFVNPNFENVTYYARVTDVKYINNETTEIEYAIDKWLTYGHEATYYDSAIVRESESLADVTKANANPYDEDLIDFDTPEDLPMSHELEECNYDVDGTDNFNLLEDTWSDWVSEISRPSLRRWMYMIAIAPFNSISQTEEDWWDGLVDYFKDDNASTQNNDPTFVWTQTDSRVYFSSYVKSMLGSLDQYTDLRSSMPRPYNCYMFPEERLDLYNEIITHSQLSQAEILAVYKIPLYVIFSMLNPTMAYNPGSHLLTILPMKHDTGTAEGLSVRHKKLCRAPYAYLELVTPFGDRKSLNYEDFKSVREGGDATIGFLTDFNLSFAISAIPVGYKMTNEGRSDAVDSTLFPQLKQTMADFNFTERLEISALPQAPYATASFLTELASQNAATLRGATQINQYDANLQYGIMNQQRESALESLQNEGVGLLNKYAGNGARVGKTLSGMNLGDLVTDAFNYDHAERDYARLSSQLSAKQLQLSTQRALENEADDLSLANLQNSLIYKNMAQTWRGYGYQYNAGTLDGRGMYAWGSFMDILVLHIRLRDEILALYDKYFDAFGLRSRRIDIPRVLKFSATENADKPSWWSVGGYNVTYIKTEGMKVGHPSKDVADYLRAMFDGGVQFINGADLT